MWSISNISLFVMSGGNAMLTRFMQSNKQKKVKIIRRTACDLGVQLSKTIHFIAVQLLWKVSEKNGKLPVKFPRVSKSTSADVLFSLTNTQILYGQCNGSENRSAPSAWTLAVLSRNSVLCFASISITDICHLFFLIDSTEVFERLRCRIKESWTIGCCFLLK